MQKCELCAASLVLTAINELVLHVNKMMYTKIDSRIFAVADLIDMDRNQDAEDLLIETALMALTLLDSNGITNADVSRWLKVPTVVAAIREGLEVCGFEVQAVSEIFATNLLNMRQEPRLLKTS